SVAHQRRLHSFPTRRSSDLDSGFDQGLLNVGERREWEFNPGCRRGQNHPVTIKRKCDRTLASIDGAPVHLVGFSYIERPYTPKLNFARKFDDALNDVIGDVDFLLVGAETRHAYWLAKPGQQQIKLVRSQVEKVASS